jgi:hypothetical protein
MTVGGAFPVPGVTVAGVAPALWTSMQPLLMMGQAAERASRLRMREGTERWAGVAEN